MGDDLTKDIESLRIDRSAQPTSPRRQSRFRRVSLALLTVAALAAVGRLAWPHIENTVFRTSIRAGQIIVVSPAQASTALTATGYVVPQILAKVAPKAFGRVERVLVREGENVRAGQILYEIDASDKASEVAAARSRATAAEARAATARAVLAELEQQISRKRRLVSAGAEARAELEDAEMRARGLGADVRAADAEAAAARADLNARLGELSQLRVTAPISGTVLQKPPERGNIVGPEDPGLEVADLSTLVAEVDVPEARLGLVQTEGPAEIVLDAFPSGRFRGVVAEIGRRVDRAKATVTVKVRFVEGIDSALPNMSARVGFLTQPLSAEEIKSGEKTLVPAAAVVERDGRRVVFVIEENGVVREHAVRVGARTGDSYELLEGPPSRTRVALDPPPALRNGQRTKVEGEN